MRILFLHQNFPGQFKHLAPALAARGDEVTALCFNDVKQLPGVRTFRVKGRYSTGAAHPWARDFDTKMIRADAVLRAAQTMLAQGYRPDVIIAHPAWGESLFVKDVWPDARLGIYCELYYRSNNADHDFDPETRTVETAAESYARTRVMNLPQRLHFDIADAGISPTPFQANTYPKEMRDRITVIHDGIDTTAVSPGPSPTFTIDGNALNADAEIITFVSRHLEPYRGLHIFLRALPELLRRRPDAHVVVVGSDGRGYGPACPEGVWRHKFLKEVEGQFDQSRVHFVGELQYPVFLNLLRLSRLHIYLTYPFVLSWSLMEAMASGCAIVANDVAPVRDFITDGHSGLLVDFFDQQALVDKACTVLDDSDLRRTLGTNARQVVIEQADLRSVCLPRQIAWVDALANAKARVGIPAV